ncbi:TonB-dependent receptor [Pseudomaricurvus alkylphenolicus]|uniref:TonB-dependent receptor domain-containing protein n=1 Tax=Pseudomaricurvus alkylphenolicus TaxID=1306991 RepID=UPI0014226C5D|nr:TonB-dependent receptor [Pseudomaricurvus alkylphenolicus]NIB42541.1 TonB-dependent receptor [Pseudomaricurvus alkylphenolicus]
MLGISRGLWLWILFLGALPVWADEPFSATIVSVRGSVDYSNDGHVWLQVVEQQRVGANTRLRTGDDSQAAVQLSSGAILRIGELSLVNLVAPAEPSDSITLSIVEGLFYFFSRRTPESVQILTPSATGAIRGTEFNLSVSRHGDTAYAIVEGEVDIDSHSESLSVRAGEVATISESGLEKHSLSNDYRELHHWLYYPPVLVPSELAFTPADADSLQVSLQFYRRGNLKQAVQSSPPPNRLNSDNARLYAASLKLMSGRLDEARQLMMTGPPNKLSSALTIMMAAVTSSQSLPIKAEELQSASQWLAYSYYLQARSDIPAALAAVRQSLQKQSNFGASWAHLAELQFSSGLHRQAQQSLDKSLQLAPDNVAAITLQGFMAAAEGAHQSAWQAFQRAHQLDNHFANVWLGEGLGAFQQGRAQQGLESLKLAVVMEPNRSLLRSYLGKALAENGEQARAAKEFSLAHSLDRHDPTPLFYQALLDKQLNRYSNAARALHKAIELNDNRSLFRSRLLLDQDLSVRKTNLATIYERLGMSTRAVRSAGMAIQADYSNYSAHRFLAESLSRDSGTNLLRTDAAIASELLLANLLAPVQTGPLSRFVSNQEYSAFFDNRYYGLDVNSSLNDDGEALVQMGGFFAGQHTSVGLDLAAGESLQLLDVNPLQSTFDLGLAIFQLKHQITSEQNLYLLAGETSLDGERTSNSSLSEEDTDSDIELLTLGLRQNWQPGRDSLIMLGRWGSDSLFQTPTLSPLLSQLNGAIIDAARLPFQARTNVEENLNFLAVSHLDQSAKRLWISGIRLQDGQVDLSQQLDHLLETTRPFFGDPAWLTQSEQDLRRATAYTYLTLGLNTRVQTTLGLSWESLQLPTFSSSPASAGELDKQRWSPKFGITWDMNSRWRLRAAYSASLGGLAADQNLRLEPTQLAGFLQAYRSVISLAPTLPGSEFDSVGLGLQYSPSAEFFLDLQYQQIRQRGKALQGAFVNQLASAQISAITLPKQLDYREHSFSLEANQLLGDRWSVAARYRFVRSTLEEKIQGLSVAATNPDLGSLAATRTEADLHSVKLSLAYHHPAGFFFAANSARYRPGDSGFYTREQASDFTSSDVKVGYRSPAQRWQVELRVDNLENADPLINALIPRENIKSRRTARVAVKLNW